MESFRKHKLVKTRTVWVKIGLPLSKRRQALKKKNKQSVLHKQGTNSAFMTQTSEMWDESLLRGSV